VASFPDYKKHSMDEVVPEYKFGYQIDLLQQQKVTYMSCPSDAEHSQNESQTMFKVSRDSSHLPKRNVRVLWTTEDMQ